MTSILHCECLKIGGMSCPTEQVLSYLNSSCLWERNRGRAWILAALFRLQSAKSPGTFFYSDLASYHHEKASKIAPFWTRKVWKWCRQWERNHSQFLSWSPARSIFNLFVQSFCSIFIIVIKALSWAKKANQLKFNRWVHFQQGIEHFFLLRARYCTSSWTHVRRLDEVHSLANDGEHFKLENLYAIYSDGLWKSKAHC